MTSILIIFIEFLIIVILAMVIKGYGKERYLMKEETKKYYAAADAHCTEYAALVLRYAHAIQKRLSLELYQGSFKKTELSKKHVGNSMTSWQQNCANHNRPANVPYQFTA